jgi:hypothetical protein
VWKGLGPATFRPTVKPQTGEPYTYGKDGFEAHGDLGCGQSLPAAVAADDRVQSEIAFAGAFALDGRVLGARR